MYQGNKTSSWHTMLGNFLMGSCMGSTSGGSFSTCAPGPGRLGEDGHHTTRDAAAKCCLILDLFIFRWGSSGTSAPGPGAYDQSTLSMQTEVEKMATNTARHGAFGVGERFVKLKAPDSAAVSSAQSCMHSFMVTNAQAFSMTKLFRSDMCHLQCYTY